MSQYETRSQSLPMTIVIGNKAYSSWSLRAWLAVHHATGGKDGFKEVMCLLAGAGHHDEARKQEILKYSPSGKVPVLFDEELKVSVYDSLAIIFHVAERFPASELLPKDPVARALCFSACAENALWFHRITNSFAS